MRIAAVHQITRKKSEVINPSSLSKTATHPIDPLPSSGFEDLHQILSTLILVDGTVVEKLAAMLNPMSRNLGLAGIVGIWSRRVIGVIPLGLRIING